MNWYDYPIVVPFGNPNFDSGLGGSHDMDVAPPPNAPVTALLPGKVVDLSSPSWGKQVGIQLDTPYNGIPFMAYLHLSATNVSLNQHVNAGDLVGWVGGANNASQYNGTSNPTGQNFLNTPFMSSQVQTGIALMRGPVYGSGAGWAQFPPIDMSLDPTQIMLDARKVNTLSVDYPGAVARFLPDSYTFTSNAQKAIVIHKTGGDASNQGVFNTFMATMRSTHYAVDLDGSVWQFVPESRGAGGNCCLEVGHNSFWDQYTTTFPNLNLCTFSIEHVDPTSDNSNPMPQAQIGASHKLVAYLCKKYRIDTLHIHSHASLDPIDKSRCPGPTYDFQALFNYVNGVQPVPTPVTDFKRAAFEQMWTALMPGISTTSGLASDAWARYQNGKFTGPVLPQKLPDGSLHDEVDAKDWGGNHVRRLYNAGGYYEWNDQGEAHYYPYQ